MGFSRFRNELTEGGACINSNQSVRKLDELKKIIVMLRNLAFFQLIVGLKT